MNWPLPQDFNEAVQNPSAVFADPDLKGGEAVAGPTGLPLPLSGNFADVYQIRGPDGRDWAVKCFTRPVSGLAQRYAQVSDVLTRAELPFTVGFTFLADGIWVRGAWRPVIKMEWVEGALLNRVVEHNADRAPVLNALFQMWVRLCRRLRDERIAHADIQHGNVLLVPGSRPGAYGLKLIDYDGMFVPSLAHTPSGEAGHPNFQHPTRASSRAYSPELDRFPHLVVATALKALEVFGSDLWQRYDSGDNLLFVDTDFRDPARSPLFRELWESPNDSLRLLVARLAVACQRPLSATPWLDEIAPDGEPLPLDPDTADEASTLLGEVATEVTPTQAEPPPPEIVEPELDEERDQDIDRRLSSRPGRRPDSDRREDWDDDPPPRRRSQSRGVGMWMVVGGAIMLAAVTLVGGLFLLTPKRPSSDRLLDGLSAVSKEEGSRPVPKPNLRPKESEAPKGDTLKGADPVGPIDNSTPKLDKEDPPPIVIEKPPPAPTPIPELQFRVAINTQDRVWVKPTGDGDWLLAYLPGRPIQIYSLRTPNPGQPGIFTDGTRLWEFRPQRDGKVVSWAANLPEAVIWDPASRQVVGKLLVGTPPAVAGEMLFDVSPDRRYVIAGTWMMGANGSPSPAGQIQVFDAERKRPVLNLSVRRPEFRFTEAGELLVADLDKCRWFKLSTGTADGEVALPIGTRPTISAVSPDGSRVLWGADRTVHVIDSRSGKILTSFAGREPIPSSGFSPDGRWVLVVTSPDPASPDKTLFLEVIDIDTGRVIGRFSLGATGQHDLTSAYFTSDMKCIVAGRLGKSILVIDLPKDAAVALGPKILIPPIKKDKDPPKEKDPPIRGGELASRWAKKISGSGKPVLVVDPGNDTVFCATSSTASFNALDLNTGEPRPGFKALSTTKVTGIFPLSNGQVGTYMESDNEVRVWLVKTGVETTQYPLPPIPPKLGLATELSVYLSPNARYLAVARNGKPQAGKNPPPVPFQLFDLTNNKTIVQFEWRGGSAHFTADSGRILVAEHSGRIGWFQLPIGQGNGGWIHAPGTAQNSRVVGNISDDGRVIAFKGPERDGGAKAQPKLPRVIDGQSGTDLRAFAGNGYDLFNSPPVVSGDGRVVVVGRKSEKNLGILEVIEWSTGTVIGRVTCKSSDPEFAIAPDGRSLAVYEQTPESTVTLFDIPP
jgi:hypothetical protein